MYGNVLQRSRFPRLEADGYDFVLVWTMGLSVGVRSFALRSHGMNGEGMNDILRDIMKSMQIDSQRHPQ